MKKSEKPAPLSMGKIMEGLESQLDWELSTQFKVSVATTAYVDAQAVWLTKHFPSWKTLLASESGISVTGFEIKDKSRGFDGFKVTANLVIDGGIDVSAIKDEKVSQWFSGGIKGILAKKILEDFPPPFDYEHPLVLAKEIYRYRINFSCRGYYWDDFHYNELNAMVFNQAVEDSKIESGNCPNFEGFKLSGGKYPVGLDLLVRWENNATNLDIFQFGRGLEKTVAKLLKNGFHVIDEKEINEKKF